jgi:putative transposase
MKRWALIKAGFSREIPVGERRSESRVKRGERGIWQRRYWEHLIRNDRDLERHVDYIHWNPVKHGWVRRAGDVLIRASTRMCGVVSIRRIGRAIPM